jgi:hypothetical protein
LVLGVLFNIFQLFNYQKSENKQVLMMNKIRKPLLLGLMMLLAACGNKGDLYVPEQEPTGTEESSG